MDSKKAAVNTLEQKLKRKIHGDQELEGIRYLIPLRNLSTGLL